jgi:alpha-ketoglutarate-dependent taurine dioxygenase
MNDNATSTVGGLVADSIGAKTRCAVVTGGGGAEGVAALAQSPAVEEALLAAGAVLFRGFGVDSPETFRASVEALTTDLIANNREHDPVSSDGVVQTPVFYAPHQKLLWHNENSFNSEWPLKIFFGCLQPAETGGETPLVDSRLVLERLDPSIVNRFRSSGVMYVRNYTPGLGLGWEKVFGSDDRRVAESICRRDGVAFEWEGDDLCTSFVRPATVRHPVTGVESWFNQIQHWHPSCLDEETRETLLEVFGEGHLPRNCFFGDGAKIDDSIVSELLATYESLETAFRWEIGDFLAVDNVLVAHGRNPYSGTRRLLVALGDVRSFEV